MEITIEELIAFCEEEEYSHRLTCKRYDDASGYARSKDKNIRTACAIREATYADFYKEISDTMRKYQKIEQDIVKPVLDKIRAEIEQLRLHKAQFLTNDNKVCINSQEVLNILDKYKSESEG